MNACLKILWVIAAAVCLASCQKPAQPEYGMQRLVSWDATKAKAQEQKLPIILLVEQRFCAYCQALKKDLFQPLSVDAKYGARGLYVSVMVDFDAPPIEVDGSTTSGFDFAQRFDASTTPTILFLDRDATEIETRVVGYLTDSTYSATLKSRIDLSYESTVSEME